MRGSVYRRSKGSWWIKVELGLDEDGKRRRHQKRGGSTRKEAESVLNDILHKVSDGTYVVPSKQTLGSFLRDEWLPAIKSTIRPSTYSSYEMNIRKHIAPAIGSVKFQTLTPGTTQRLLLAPDGAGTR